MNPPRRPLFLLTVLILSLPCLGAGAFHIPKEKAAAVVGTWKLVKMGVGDDLKDVEEQRTMTLTLKADGTGTQQKRNRDIPIVWGATKDGVMALQWVQEDGKGDGAMGTWEKTDEGLKLSMQEVEDGEQPEDDHFVLLFKPMP